MIAGLNPDQNLTGVGGQVGGCYDSTRMNSTMTPSDLFADLCTRYPTSEALFAYLTSEEGGCLTVRQDKATSLAIIYYEKLRSNLALPHVRYFRSVIWDPKVNRPVAWGPPKFRSFNEAIDAGVDVGAPNTFIQDFVDGTMINVFFYGGAWQVATRTVIGATGSFYGKRPFVDLFWETFEAMGLTEDMMLPNESYTFVLQHPEERIVVAPTYGIARLHLVYHTTPVLPTPLEKIVPTRHTDLRTLEDVKERVSAFGKRLGWAWQGLVIHMPETGVTYKLRSAEYDDARLIRGNQANRAYIWLERWSEGRLHHYLRQYPEEEIEALAVVEAFKAATKEIHDFYLKVYRLRELPLGQAPQKYRKLLWDAHAAHGCAYFPNMRRFMNEQDTARKLWLVNWERRFGGTQPVPLDPLGEHQ